ncbi:MAG: ribosome silencing factor, partial [Halieaceae bacterium]|nr:ribosome silencing factor [Halieaceae bacterium]
MTDLTASEHDALTGLVLDALDDLKAVDPVVIDVKALSSVMD